MGHIEIWIWQSAVGKPGVHSARAGCSSGGKARPFQTPSGPESWRRPTKSTLVWCKVPKTAIPLPQPSKPIKAPKRKIPSLTLDCMEAGERQTSSLDRLTAVFMARHSILDQRGQARSFSRCMRQTSLRGLYSQPEAPQKQQARQPPSVLRSPPQRGQWPERCTAGGASRPGRGNSSSTWRPSAAGSEHGDPLEPQGVSLGEDPAHLLRSGLGGQVHRLADSVVGRGPGRRPAWPGGRPGKISWAVAKTAASSGGRPSTAVATPWAARVRRLFGVSRPRAARQAKKAGVETPPTPRRPKPGGCRPGRSRALCPRSSPSKATGCRWGPRWSPWRCACGANHGPGGRP